RPKNSTACCARRRYHRQRQFHNQTDTPLWRAAPAARGAAGAAGRLGAPPSGPRRHCVHRPPRPSGDRPGRSRPWGSEDVRRVAGVLTTETVVEVEGQVTARPANMKNAELATGDVEVQATKLAVVGPAVTPAIPVARGKGEELPAEELRLKHRQLDLRRPEMQGNLMLRHRLLQRARRTLCDLEFLEIETPVLTKPTPEGARDYLVPSRVHPGEFYA